MRVLVAAKLSDFKLRSILDPLIYSDKIEEIFLVRRFPLLSRRVKCFCPPDWIARNVYLSEIWRFFTILSLCRKKNVDYLIGIHYLYHGMFVAIAGLLFKKPYIISLIEEPKLYQRDVWFRFFMLSAKKIFVRGRQSRRFLKEKMKIDLSKIEVLTDLVDLSLDLPEDFDPFKRKYDFIFLGEFSPAKRLDILVRTISKLKRIHPAVKVLLVGDGALFPRVKNWVEHYGVSEQIHLVGNVPNDRIGDFLLQAKFFLMTSSTEGLPVAMIEALNYGLPYIVPDVGDIPDIVANEDNGLVVKPLSVKDFAAACHRLLTDPKLHEECVVSNFKLKTTIRDQYTLPYLTEQWNRVLI